MIPNQEPVSLKALEIRMEKLENDINDLYPRTNIKLLLSNEDCDWLIIGAGYTGLSAARKLGKINPNLKIILADAQLAGEGASGRNSGYLVDTTLNDGFTSSSDIENYKKKLGIIKFNLLSLKTKCKIIALGGINKSNLKQLKMTNAYGFSGIKYFN